MSGPDASPGTSGKDPSAVAGSRPAEEVTAAEAIRVLVICVLAWAVPGLGHIASGRIGRGIIFALADRLGLPIRFIGVGEGLEDLRDFEATAFIDALFDQ